MALSLLSYYYYYPITVLVIIISSVKALKLTYLTISSGSLPSTAKYVIKWKLRRIRKKVSCVKVLT